MYYAGPREAVHHSKIREKLGFSYFSVDESPPIVLILLVEKWNINYINIENFA